MGIDRRLALSGAAIAVLAALLLAALLWAGSAGVRGRGESPAMASTPTWRLTSYRHIGYDRSFKADLIDELPEAPRLVVFGGSRAMRFEPSYFAEHAGLTAFNCAVQNCRPEDAYAFSSYVFSRAPDVKLDCFFAVQTTTFLDAPLHPGLLYDERLSRAFPAALVARQKAALSKPPVKELLGATGTPRAASCSATPTTSDVTDPTTRSTATWTTTSGHCSRNTGGPGRRGRRARAPTSRRRCGSSTTMASSPPS